MESSDSSDIIIDINSAYSNTTTSLSQLFAAGTSLPNYYTHVSINRLLSSYYTQTITDSLLTS
jgi:hypothetical protein